MQNIFWWKNLQYIQIYPNRNTISKWKNTYNKLKDLKLTYFSLVDSTLFYFLSTF